MTSLVDYEEHKERYLAAVQRFKNGDITIKDFRLLLGYLKFNATEIESEIEQVRREQEDGV